MGSKPCRVFQMLLGVVELELFHAALRQLDKSEGKFSAGALRHYKFTAHVYSLQFDVGIPLRFADIRQRPHGVGRAARIKLFRGLCEFLSDGVKRCHVLLSFLPSNSARPNGYTSGQGQGI